MQGFFGVFAFAPSGAFSHLMPELVCLLIGILAGAGWTQKILGMQAYSKVWDSFSGGSTIFGDACL